MFLVWDICYYIFLLHMDNVFLCLLLHALQTTTHCLEGKEQAFDYIRAEVMEELNRGDEDNWSSLESECQPGITPLHRSGPATEVFLH